MFHEHKNLQQQLNGNGTCTQLALVTNQVSYDLFLILYFCQPVIVVNVEWFYQMELL